MNELPQKVKLTDWDNEPSVTDLRKDLIEASSTHSAEVARIDKYLDNLLVRGTAEIKPPKGRSSVQPKLIRKQAEWRYAALSEPFLSTEDLFNVDPVANDDVEAARQNQIVINNQFNTKLNKVALIGHYVRNAVNTGTVICKTGWAYEEEKYVEDVPVFEYLQSYEEGDAMEIQSLLDLMQSNPEEFENNVSDEWKEAANLSIQNNIVVVPNQTGIEKVEKTRIIKNHPTVEVLNYKHVIIDPTANGDIDKASFVIYKYTTSLSELKKKGGYQNLDLIVTEVDTDVLDQSDTEFQTKNNNFRFSDKSRQKLVCYEYWGFWDIDNSGIVKPIVATFVGNIMIKMIENPFPDKKLPFVLVPYLPRFEENYGESDGELLADNQRIIGATTRGIIDLMGRSANSQIGYAKGVLDTVNRKKFLAGDDYEFNPNTHPEQAFWMHKYPEIPQSAYNLIMMQNQEAEAITGVKSFHGGISGQALGNTATGVRSALDATSKRDLEILRRLAEGIKDIGRKIIAMNAVWLSEEEVVRITNEKFVTIRRDDLAGNFDLKLTISTAEVDNQKAEELAYMLQTLGPNVDFSISQMMLAEIARLRKMPKLATAIEQYQPQPDPIAVEKAQLENELLKAQIEEARAKAQAAISTIGVNQTKANSEMAKANKLNAETDRTNLDYVEQETGTNHERELDKIRTQGQVKAQDTLLKEAAKAEAKSKE